jgi:hypothetical protein
MRMSILAAASALALGIGGIGVGHATPGPSSASGQTTQWMAGYGVPATPAQMARVWKEEGHHRQLAAQYQQLAAQSQQQRGAQGRCLDYACLPEREIGSI